MDAPTADPIQLFHGDSCVVAGIVHGSPSEVFELLCSPQEQLGVITSIKDVKVHEEKEEAGVGKEVEYTMAAVASLFGKSWTTTLRLKLVADHATKASRFNLVTGNALIADMEGTNLVLPLPEGSQQDGEEMGDLQDALSLAVQRFLRGEAPPTRDTHHGAQRSIVIMASRTKPRLAPPPPFGRLLRGNLLSSSARNLRDVMARFSLKA